jgi:hypothetical protein
MVFNSDSYHANKYARQAWERLAQVRDIKKRAARGEAYVWEVERMPRLVEQARQLMRLSILYRSFAKLKKQQRTSSLVPAP